MYNLLRMEEGTVGVEPGSTKRVLILEKGHLIFSKLYCTIGKKTYGRRTFEL